MPLEAGRPEGSKQTVPPPAPVEQRPTDQLRTERNRPRRLVTVVRHVNRRLTPAGAGLLRLWKVTVAGNLQSPLLAIPGGLERMEERLLISRLRFTLLTPWRETTAPGLYPRAHRLERRLGRR